MPGKQGAGNLRWTSLRTSSHATTGESQLGEVFEAVYLKIHMTGEQNPDTEKCSPGKVFIWYLYGLLPYLISVIVCIDSERFLPVTVRWTFEQLPNFSCTFTVFLGYAFRFLPHTKYLRLTTKGKIHGTKTWFLMAFATSLQPTTWFFFLWLCYLNSDIIIILPLIYSWFIKTWDLL